MTNHQGTNIVIKQYISFAVATGIAFATNNAIANTDPFVEHNGRLIVETETGNAGGAWSFENSIEGHTGDGYLVWEGSNNFGKSEVLRGNPIQYHVRIENAGNYELRWRSRNTVGLDATEHNDSWVRFPSGKNIEGQHFLDGWTKAYMGQVAQWTWDAYTVDGNNESIRQYFEAGDHLIEIAGRSNGHGLDRFALYRYEQEAFNVGLFDALTPSPRASQEGLPSHAYIGHSCVGNTLSLAAESALSFSDIASHSSGDTISIDSSQHSALLRFDVPQLPAFQASLKLANAQPNDGLSAYLGSHSDWTTITAVEELPHASLLLGTYDFTNAQDQVQSLSLDGGVVTPGQLTVVLGSDNGLSQTVYGIASALEPRLEFNVSTAFCADYQAINTGTQSPESFDQEALGEDSGETTSSLPDDSQADNSGSDNEIDTETDADADSGEQEAPSPFDVIDSQTADNTNTLSVVTTTRRSGAISGWTLLIFALTSGLFRLRRKQQ